MAARDVRDRAASVTHRVVEGVSRLLVFLIRRVGSCAVTVIDHGALGRILRDRDRGRVHVAVVVRIVRSEIDQDRRRLRRRDVVRHSRRDLVLGAVLVVVPSDREARAARLAAGVREADLVIARGRLSEWVRQGESLIILRDPRSLDLS